MTRVLAVAVALLAAIAPIAAPTSLAAQPAAPTAAPRSARDSAPALARGKDANDWREYYAEGLRLIERKLPKSADRYFLWAARLNPQTAEPVHMHWVALSLMKGHLLEIEPGKGTARDEAERAGVDSVLMEALRIDPFTPRHYARYVYEGRAGYWRRDALTQGYLAYTEARYDRAVRLLAHVREGDRLMPARMFRALSFYAMERYDSAAVELELLAALASSERATTLAPSYEGPAVYLYGVGMARLRLGDLDGARDALTRALGEDVSLAAAHVALAKVAAARGDTTEALHEWAMAVELRPSSAAMHGGYANALHAFGRHEEAVAEYERAIALEPHWADPYFNEATVLDRLRRGPEAVTRYAQFLARAPLAYTKPIEVARARIAALNGG